MRVILLNGTFSIDEVSKTWPVLSPMDPHTERTLCSLIFLACVRTGGESQIPLQYCLHSNTPQRSAYDYCSTLSIKTLRKYYTTQNCIICEFRSDRSEGNCSLALLDCQKSEWMQRHKTSREVAWPHVVPSGTQCNAGDPPGLGYFVYECKPHFPYRALEEALIGVWDLSIDFFPQSPSNGFFHRRG